MIEIKDKDGLREICNKLKYVKDCLIDEQSFYFHLYAGLLNKQIFSYATYKDGQMKGCLVLSLGKDLSPDLILYLVFVWIDKHCPKLWKEYVEFTEKKAKELGVNRILINTKRNPKVIERKLGKYGYKEKYVIFEKEVKIDG